jgi:hypothetical protein
MHEKRGILKDKKPPGRRFFEILWAKRNKLPALVAPVLCCMPFPVMGTQ